MKAIEQYFHVVLFIMLYKVLQVTIQMNASEQYFHVVLFILLYRVLLTFRSVDETLESADHSKESY